MTQPREGAFEFKHASISKPCHIWYKITGPWPARVKSKPLVTLHGGPGYTHDYMLPLQDLSKSPHSLTVIFFDQVGSGKSTHFPEKHLDYEFWSLEFFLDQVTAVLEYLQIQDNYDLFGHSWGGMLATIHAARQPQGLKSLIIAHAIVDGQHWKEKYREFRDQMPEPHRTILNRSITIDQPADDAYTESLREFYRKHFIIVDPIPEELMKSWNEIEADPTPTLSALGPDEFDMTGSLAGFSSANDLKNIKAKTLVLNGVDEGCDHEESIRLFKQIEGCKHVVFKKSTHFAWFEEQEAFMRTLAGFLIDE